MKTTIILLALALLSLSACGPGSPDPRFKVCGPGEEQDINLESNLKAAWFLDRRLPDSVTEAVLDAADAWREETGGRVDPTFVSATGYLPLNMVIRGSRDGELKDGVLATYAPSMRAILIRPGLDESIVRPIVVHEMGHAWGLCHSADESSIMFPSAHEGMPDRPTPDTLSDLAYLYGW